MGFASGQSASAVRRCIAAPGTDQMQGMHGASAKQKAMVGTFSGLFLTPLAVIAAVFLLAVCRHSGEWSCGGDFPVWMVAYAAVLCAFVLLMSAAVGVQMMFSSAPAAQTVHENR